MSTVSTTAINRLNSSRNPTRPSNEEPTDGIVFQRDQSDVSPNLSFLVLLLFDKNSLDSSQCFYLWVALSEVDCFIHFNDLDELEANAMAELLCNVEV